MKRILGLDLGKTSIGWALVEEAESKDEKSSIIRVGTRVNPLTVDEQTNFEKGKPLTTNAGRTLKRGMRRNLQRYKLRRENLKDAMIGYGWITRETILAEQGNRTTFETLRLRAKAATQEITLEEFARVLLNINKKRGYKSNRKAKDENEGQAIDGLSVANELHKSGITPGQYCYEWLQGGNSRVPEFYQSDLSVEFDTIWNTQKQFYPELLTDELKKELNGKSRKQVWGICREHLGVVGVKREKKPRIELIKENYEWRAKSVNEKIGLEELTEVFQDISGQIQNSTSYLGKISDRHKELYFNNMTVGQYMMVKLDADPNFSFKNTVFYRQDYIDEFERIWAKQAEFHPELTNERKKEISDAIIFYQRPLKSKKSLVDICEFENHKKVVLKDGKETVKTIGLKVCPKASPLFQEFKVWQTVNNVTINGAPLAQEKKEQLFSELNIRPALSTKDAVKLLCGKEKGKRNYREKLEGNRTNAAMINAYLEVLEDCGYEVDLTEITAGELYKEIEDVFQSLGYRTDFLHFDACLEGEAYEFQPAYKLWHLIYSYEGDKSVSGDESLIAKIMELTGFSKEHAQILSRLTFESDYRNLSSKAIRKIMPFLRQGYVYSDACEMAGYRHSKSSLTREELDAKELKDHLDLLPKNSLRNPVVEKILNQMVNVVNTLIDTYGKPDEIRIELARELKRNAAEREEMTKGIAEGEKQNAKYREILINEFGISEPSHNDILRYKLYEELSVNHYHTLYSDTYIPAEKLFAGKEFDIEHIIPQAKLFDDSFSNKTLEVRQINIDKGNTTAYDFMKARYGEEGLTNYISRVENLFKNGKISKTKRERLLTSETRIPEETIERRGRQSDEIPFPIPDGFINRDLRETQYITKKAKAMLEEIVRDVVTTTGSITDRLREDWQLVNVMQELNWDKYNKQGLTEYVQDRDGRNIPRIKGWTKRNDHRHHAVDALIIAFTKLSYIQYLNNLNARVSRDFGDDEKGDLRHISISDLPFEARQRVVRAIEKAQLTRDDKGKMRFIPPMPLDEFRREAKKQIADSLVSIKAKNKVVTQNVNKTKIAGGGRNKVQLTPRGQLHKETIYGKISRYVTSEEKVGAKFTAEKIATVANQSYREALARRLDEFGGDPQKAFTGKNGLEKNPIYTDEAHFNKVPEKVKVVQTESMFTIKEQINPDLRVDKVIDEGARRILQARLEEYGNDPKKAFSNLDQNPIWLNKEKGIQMKSVKISGVSNAIALHDKADNLGNKILDVNGRPVPADYVSTGNNHHIAIFKDADGNLQEHVVPFFDAVAQAGLGMSVIDRNYKKDEGWEFLFTMKQNEYFVFPNKETGFDPNEIDLMNPENYSIISPNLFRVQKLATKNYVFRHHLETTIEDNVHLRDITWKRIQNTNALRGIVKVRVNHIGQIVQVGEY